MDFLSVVHPSKPIRVLEVSATRTSIVSFLQTRINHREVLQRFCRWKWAEKGYFVSSRVQMAQYGFVIGKVTVSQNWKDGQNSGPFNAISEIQVDENQFLKNIKKFIATVINFELISLTNSYFLLGHMYPTSEFSKNFNTESFIC